MQRIPRFPALALATTMMFALTGSIAASITTVAQGSPSAHAARAAKVTLRHTHLGTILATSSGFTLYEFTRDRTNHNSCVTIRECPQFWPAYTTTGRPSAGPGVRSSLLSSIRIAGGRSQVTYAGHPLYLYSGDSSPGETSYVGESAFGGRWYALNSSGRTIR
jgi:predicted lipoprotein with Yx(FWY)xxD motif